MQVPFRPHRGVRFQCIGCGRCCSGESDGHVYVYNDDIRAISAFIHMSEADFINQYCEIVEDLYEGKLIKIFVIKANPATNSCIFQQEDMACSIYPARPFQCLNFPFWYMNLESKEAWNSVREHCPGFTTDISVHLYTIQEITAFLRKEKNLEEQHYQDLKQNNFSLSIIYHCLQDQVSTVESDPSATKQPRPIFHRCATRSCR